MYIIKQLYSPDCPIVVELGCPASSTFPGYKTRMKRNNSEAAVYADSVKVQEGSSGEIDLYAELTAFEQLTPEEKASLAVHPEISTAEENPPEDDNDDSFETASESSINEQVLTLEQKSDIDTASTFETPIDEKGIDANQIQSDVSVKPNGPLESFEGNMFTGDLSRGVCLACGAESTTDDLFCLACGVFIEDF
jgi:hypothetical protein